MTKRQVTKYLIAARDLMNDNGAHWIKRSLRQQLSWRTGHFGYCALGGIFTVAGKPFHPGSAAAYKLNNDTRPVVYALAHAITGKVPASDASAVATVWRWNDAYRTTWDTVHNTFTKAAEQPVWK